MAVYDVDNWDATEGTRRHTAHVVPVADLVVHDVDYDGDCVCGPDTVPVRTADGRYGWMFVHHSLDGRERDEETPDGA
jgi:hypothetical protein